MSVGSEPLVARARRGDIEAQIELGQRYETENNVQAARGCFATAAKAGSVVGLRLLAINLLSQEPVDGQAGINMIRAAADKGDAEAALVCANLAAGDINLPDRATVARQCLEVAVERGSVLARAQLDFVKKSSSAVDVASLRQQEMFAAPRISVIEGFASRAECDWLVERARPLLHRARVYDPKSGGFYTKDARNNSSVEFGIANSDVVLMGLRLRIQEISGLHRLEASSILHYAPGQEFKPHYDFLDTALPGYALDVQRSGQRAATFLIYMNEGFEGGETEFLKLDWRYKGRKGDALLFWNTDPNGRPDLQTFHAGLPTTNGEKWLFSQWLRFSPV